MSRTLPPGVGAVTDRWLFSQHFLTERLPEWTEFASQDLLHLHGALSALWDTERASLLAGANEGQTEERFIRPVLRLLSHSFTLFADIPGAGKTPDYFFYSADAERDAAERAAPIPPRGEGAGGGPIASLGGSDRNQ